MRASVHSAVAVRIDSAHVQLLCLILFYFAWQDVILLLINREVQLAIKSKTLSRYLTCTHPQLTTVVDPMLYVEQASGATTTDAVANQSATQAARGERSRCSFDVSFKQVARTHTSRAR